MEVGGVADSELLPLNFASLRRQLSPEHGDDCSAVRGKMTAAPELAVRLAGLLTIINGRLTVLSLSILCV